MMIHPTQELEPPANPVRFMTLVRSAPFAPGSGDLWSCGPAGLWRALLSVLAHIGQSPRGVRYEYFDFA